MADANREYVVTYVVVGPGNVAPRCLSFNQEQRPGLVVHLGMLLRQAEGWDANTQYDLYKADFTEQELQGLRDNVLPSMDRTTKLHGLDVVDKCWPEGFAKTELDLVVELKSDAPPLESSRKGFRAGREYYERAAPEQLRALSAIGGNRSSSLAIPSNFKKHQASKGALYNGRPQSRAGPPIGLYCPVFDSFVAGLDPTLDITSVQLQGTIDLLKRSQSQYPTELKVSGRTAAVFPGLDLLLEAKLVVREGAGIKADGIISALNGAPLLVAELKNEVGQGGADPSIQGAIAFAMYWNNPNLDDIRPASCCPSFILAIAGPWMCVLGAILLDHPVVQRLTDYVWVGDDSKPATHLNVCKLARMFASLSSSVKTLDDFYRGLKCNKKDKTRFYPYLRHFEVNGQRMEFQYNESVSLDKLVFEASMGSKTDERTIIVKFAESYHVEAHQLLANAGLAPALLFASSEQVAGRFMIVVERVDGDDLVGLMSAPECVKKSVLAALELLHKHGIVFGDLQPSNVMAVMDDQGQPVRGMLVDFDWCGIEDKAKYPATMDMEIKWPDGVGPGVVMKAEHDREMFGKMFPS